MRLPDPPLPRPTTRLSRLAAQLGANYPEFDGARVADLRLPLKTSDEVLATLVRGDVQSLGALEWMMFLSDRTWWKGRRTVHQEISWIAAAADNNHSLRELTLSCVALAAFGGGHCAAELVALAREGKLCERSLRASLLAELLRKDTKALAMRCRRSVKSPEDLIHEASFPLPSVTDLTQIRRACFGTRPKQQQQDFYLALLAQLETSDIEHAVLRGWRPEDSDDVPRVRDWLVEYFERHGEDDLSPLGRERLQAWRGSTHFDEFQKVARLLEDRAFELQFSTFQLNQLKSRVSFWSTFRGSFLGVQFLFPAKTYKRLVRRYPHASEFDGEAEVCLFDFGNHVVVEVLRSMGGRRTAFDGGETRLLERATADSWRVSGGGLRDLRRRPVLLVHDHKVRWQQGLYLALQHFGITPMPKQRYTNFATRDGAATEYTASSKMSQKQLSKRSQVFLDWVESSHPPVRRRAFPAYMDGR